MKPSTRTLVFSLLLGLAVFAPLASFAQTDGFGFGNQLDNVANKSGYNPGTDVPIEQRVSSIISIVLSFLGVIFMVLMIVAGFNWMTAGGDQEKINHAKDTIRNALIGIIIVIAAYAASVFVIEKIWGTTSGTIGNSTNNGQ